MHEMLAIVTDVRTVCLSCSWNQRRRVQCTLCCVCGVIRCSLYPNAFGLLLSFLLYVVSHRFELRFILFLAMHFVNFLLLEEISVNIILFVSCQLWCSVLSVVVFWELARLDVCIESDCYRRRCCISLIGLPRLVKSRPPKWAIKCGVGG